MDNLHSDGPDVYPSGCPYSKTYPRTYFARRVGFMRWQIRYCVHHKEPPPIGTASSYQALFGPAIWSRVTALRIAFDMQQAYIEGFWHGAP